MSEIKHNFNLANFFFCLAQKNFDIGMRNTRNIPYAKTQLEQANRLLNLAKFYGYGK